MQSATYPAASPARPKDGMFAIIITEKGGTERREVFDKTEINVGRVQGNELMLPKGNVSKHHARLLYRDGRFIVTDLKSTNGTYVNGRKITQATIVREGDKIYIGDFILRLEVPQQAAPAASPPSSPEQADPMSSSRGPARVPVPQRPSQDAGVSHYPLENDPDEPSWSGADPAPAAPVRVPAPPRLPSAAHAPIHTAPAHAPPAARPAPVPAVPARPPIAMPPTPAAEPSAPGVSPSAASRTPSVPAVARVGAQPRPGQPTPVPHAAPETVQIPPQRVAAAALLRRIEDSFDLSSIDDGSIPDKDFVERVEHSLREEIAAIRASGEMATNVDMEAVVREARDELVGFGPLEALLRDDDVAEIHIHRHSWVSTTRVSGPRRAEIPFASEASLQRIIRRLCVRGAAPARTGETVVERFVASEGVHLVAAFSPVAQPGTTATLRKCGPASQSLDDLVKAGVMSRAMASLLSSAVSGHLNVLVAAGSGTDARGLMSALLSVTRSGEHVVVFQDVGCHPALPRNATSILAANNKADSVAAVRSAASLGADCVFVSALQGDIAAEVLDAIGNGAEGVVALTRAPSLRHAIARLVPDIAAHRPGVSVDAVREAVAAAFDLYVELARMRDGRVRVLRIAEPAGVEGITIAQRDIFAFIAERTATGGTIEGSFHPAGVVPHAITDLQSRGVVVDPSLFRR